MAVTLALGPDYFIRPWRNDDVEALVRHANDRRIWLNLTDALPHPYTEESARAFLAHVARMTPVTWLAIANREEAIGGIGYTLREGVERVGAEMGYWLGAAYWGRGIMTRAVTALTSFAFEQHPELCRLFAVPYAWNPASARVLEKAGYRLEGLMRQSAIKDGRVVDQLLYARTREMAGPAFSS